MFSASDARTRRCRRNQDLGDTGDLRRRPRPPGRRPSPATSNIDLAAAVAGKLGRAERVQGRRLELGVVVIGNYKDSCHQILTPASFLSLSTSSRDARRPCRRPRAPADRSTLSSVTRRAHVDAQIAGRSTSIVFFFAFMMLGSEA